MILLFFIMKEETFRVSSQNLLKVKSIEIFQDPDALLSARGLRHRSIEVFQKELKNTTQIITSTKTATGIAPSHLFHPYFQRALAHERLNEIDKAISDYTSCIRIRNDCAEAYFNRSGLSRLKGKLQSAIADMDKAVTLDPLNLAFRRNRSLLYREDGRYKDALSDTRICKMLAKSSGKAR